MNECVYYSRDVYVCARRELNVCARRELNVCALD